MSHFVHFQIDITYLSNVPSPFLLGVKVLTKRDAEPTLYSLMEYIVMLDLVGKKAAASVVHSAAIPRTPLWLVHGCENLSGKLRQEW